MHINLTTPMSGDKERERHTKAVIDAIEKYTEERMNDEYGRIHTDGSRSGGQPTQGYGVVTAANYTSPIGGAGVVTHGVVGVATQSDANERLGAWLSAVLDDPNCSEAFKQDINNWFASQPTQSDALREAVIEECAKALEADARLCDCAARNEDECACGAWDDYKSITSARAVEIVRALNELSK